MFLDYNKQQQRNYILIREFKQLDNAFNKVLFVWGSVLSEYLHSRENWDLVMKMK